MTIKKVHKLKYAPDYDFSIYGIISDEKDYKLIWDINNSTGWSLERKDNYRCYNRKTLNEPEFPFFIYHDTDSYSIYRLISNKYNEHFLIEELRNIDYLLIIHDESGITDSSLITENLKKINSIRAVYPLNIGRLKEKEKLLF